MDGWMGEWMEGWMEGWICNKTSKMIKVETRYRTYEYPL